MPNRIDLSSYRSIVCLNGELPDASFINSLNLPVIAADGAANHLCGMGVRPSLITGDLDSVNPFILQQFPSLHLPDQNQTDYQKTMEYLQHKKLLPAIILGINGGYLDHVLNNINIFMDSDCLLYAPPIRGFVIKEQNKANLRLEENTKISLIGLPHAVCSSKGLKWDLDQDALSFPGKTSCFNRCQQADIQLETHSGAVLVLIYDLHIHDAGLG